MLKKTYFDRNKFEGEPVNEIVDTSVSLPNLKNLFHNVRKNTKLSKLSNIQKAVYIIVKMMYEIRKVTDGKNAMMDNIRDINGAIGVNNGKATADGPKVDKAVNSLFEKFDKLNMNDKVPLKNIEKSFGGQSGGGLKDFGQKLIMLFTTDDSVSSVKIESKIKLDGVTLYSRPNGKLSLEAICTWLVNFLSIIDRKLKNKDATMTFFANENKEKMSGSFSDGEIFNNVDKQDFFSIRLDELRKLRDTYLFAKYSQKAKTDDRIREELLSFLVNCSKVLDFNIFSNFERGGFKADFGFKHLKEDINKANGAPRKLLRRVSSGNLKKAAQSEHAPTAGLTQEQVNVVAAYDNEYLDSIIKISNEFAQSLQGWVNLGGAPRNFLSQVKTLEEIKGNLSKVTKNTTLKRCQDIMRTCLENIASENALNVSNHSLDQLLNLNIPIVQIIAKTELSCRDLAKDVNHIIKATKSFESSKVIDAAAGEASGLKVAINGFFARLEKDFVYILGEFNEPRIVEFINICREINSSKNKGLGFEIFCQKSENAKIAFEECAEKGKQSADSFNSKFGEIEDRSKEAIQKMGEFLRFLQNLK